MLHQDVGLHSRDSFGYIKGAQTTEDQSEVATLRKYTLAEPHPSKLRFRKAGWRVGCIGRGSFAPGGVPEGEG